MNGVQVWTPFQRLCEERTSELLAKRGMSLVGRVQEKRLELYWHARISGTNLRLWVYEDEAQINGEGLNYIYEAADFSSQEELVDALLGDLAAYIDGQDCSAGL